MESFICPRCGNKNERYIGYKNGKPYCRLCISMKGEMAKENIPSKYYPVLSLHYDLSPEQKKISDKIISNFKSGIDTLVYAVCGAGKTELIFGVIQYALTKKMNVGFAIPRRDVCIELFHRVKEAFPHNNVVSVYGGHTSELNGDIIVLTTHQLFRYPEFFDLLILDEIDAFPYNGNALLNSMFKKSLKGHSVLMSATPSEEILSLYRKGKREILELNTRFHKHPLPVPKIVVKKGISRFISLIKYLKLFNKENKPVFVFVPTIEMAENLFSILRIFCKGGNIIHSKQIFRQKIIENFRENKYKYLVTTAVLERGVTIKNLQVIIYNSDHCLYNEYSLVQIAGRVGRKFDAPKGEVIFLASKETKDMRKAREKIISKNKFL